MQIEGKELAENDVYGPVTYVPNHADGNAGHKDCELGVIIRWDDERVFVLYCKSRTIQSTDPSNLVWG